MAGIFFQRCWLAGLGLFAAASIFLFMRHLTSPDVERWFLPGPIGYEARSVSWFSDGSSPLVGSQTAHNRKPITDYAPRPARGFLTRATSGVDPEWSRLNHLTATLAFSHHLGGVFPPELYGQHPEFFPLVEGRRLQPPSKGVLFWNPDIARADVAVFAADAARRQFDAHPEQKSFALGVNDALTFGESPELLALVMPQRWFRERPDYSNLVFTFMNRAAQELARTHPQKYLGALAYYWAENAPDFPLNPQVVPFLTADRSQGYDPKFWQEEMDLQERWGSVAGATPPQAADGRGQVAEGKALTIGPHSDLRPQSSETPPPRRLGLYDYLYGGGFLIPRIHTKLLAANLRHARRVGFTDYYAEVNPNWGLDGPMPWLAAQLLQDPEQPAVQLLDEYYRRYFKEAAEPMRRFFELCEQRWMDQPGPAYWLKHYRNESQAIIFPSVVCRELRVLLDEALTRTSSEIVRQRVNLVRKAFGVTERFVGFEEARDTVARMALAPVSDWRVTLSALQVCSSARREFIRYTTELQQAEPLAMAPFGWDDYLKNDPGAEVLLSVRAAAMAQGEGREADAMIKSWSEPVVSGLWQSLAAMPLPPGKELLRNSAFTGPIQAARRIAGLEYGVALPGDWASRVEPAQFHQATLMENPVARVLRLSGTKDTSVSQWDPVGGAGLHLAAISVRGHVSPGTIVSLTFAWLDAQEHHLGFKAMRLPDGEWPDWVTLRQAGEPPAGAIWVGMGLRVQNQVAGDWIEAREFHLLVQR